MSDGAVVLLSGGLDSATTLAVAIRDQRQAPIVAVSFDYGQRHRCELTSAMAIVEVYAERDVPIEHVVIPLPFAWCDTSALTSTVPVPTHRDLATMAAEIPVTYVPARNLVFLALAASVAETRGIQRLYYGANQIDYSGYADCRLEFVRALTHVLNVGTKFGAEDGEWEIIAPLLLLGKAAIIRLGLVLDVPYALTWSCYAPRVEVPGDGRAVPCGVCDSCVLRAAGFADVGIDDPAR